MSHIPRAGLEDDPNAGSMMNPTKPGQIRMNTTQICDMLLGENARSRQCKCTRSKQATHFWHSSAHGSHTHTHTHTHTRKYTYKPGKHTTPHQTHVYTNTTFTIPSPITRIETRHVWPCCLLLIVFETCCRRKERHLQRQSLFHAMDKADAGKHTRPGPLLVAAWRFVIFHSTTRRQEKKKDQSKHTRIHHDYHHRRSRPP